MVLWTYWSFWKQVCHDYFSNSPPLCACVLCVWLINMPPAHDRRYVNCDCVLLTNQKWPSVRVMTWVYHLCVCCGVNSKVTSSTCHDMGELYVCLLWWSLEGDLQYVLWHGWTSCVFALVRTRRWPPGRVMTWVNDVYVCCGENSKLTSSTQKWLLTHIGHWMQGSPQTDS